MSRVPPISENEFLKATANYREFSRKLGQLGIPTTDLLAYAEHIFLCWFNLGKEHYAEAQQAITLNCPRTVYSRSYYAAYNASKAIRYLDQGFVSLKGDDHSNASSNLPSDFPDVAQWSAKITQLFEHRLHADYDNWTNTGYSMTPADAIAVAGSFIEEVRQYANRKHGTNL